MSNIVLELNHLKKYYGTNKGIEDVSIKLEKGDIYGFIGPNGAGKSTTIRTIMGLINKTNGEIFFNGHLLNIDDIDAYKNIGYLPSEVHLYEDMTVKSLFNYHASFYKKETTKKRQELVKLLNIDESKKIEDLSLGNLKKVGIVLALMHEPDLLIFDEPTSGLDPIMQNVFHDILLKENKRGATILYSSHVLSEVSSICNKIGFIKDGKIIKEDLMENIKKDNYTYLTIASKDIKKIKKALKLEVKSESSNEIVFINRLHPDVLIEKLAKFKIDKLLIENVSLEDLFENYYK